MSAAIQSAFETMAENGGGDAGALAVGLRRGVTSLGLRSLAAKAVHVAAAAPERMADIYDNAAAGWLSRPVFPPRLRTAEPLPISADFWRAFWGLVGLPAALRREDFARRLLSLIEHLEPAIEARMAATALTYEGVAEAADGAPGDLFPQQAWAASLPGSLGFALRDPTLHISGIGEPFASALLPLLRHMPPPLDYINVRIIQTLPLMSVVAGYGGSRLDQMALAGFLMGQVGHHYSAMATAVTLTILALERPKGLEIMLECIFKGWLHGRETPQLIGAPWEALWQLPIGEVRAALGVIPFQPPLRVVHS